MAKFEGTPFNDYLLGMDGNDELYGRGGNDRLVGAKATTCSTVGPAPIV